MNPERWKKVNDLFHEALAHDRATRDAFVFERASPDAQLLKEVQSLLAAHESSEHFMEVPAWGVAPELMFDEQEEPTLSGRTIGPYRVFDEVGRGGMGVVYAAEDTRLGREVALKALTPDYTSDPARRERLRREARAAASLSHRSIATVYALEEIDGDLFIVSELVRGNTLREELRSGPLPPERLQATLLEIADALAAAHARGIVHRDLKPENVIRGVDGHVKVLDFGLARIAGQDADSQPDQAHPADRRRRGGGHTRIHGARSSSQEESSTRAPMSSPSVCWPRNSLPDSTRLDRATPHRSRRSKRTSSARGCGR